MPRNARLQPLDIAQRLIPFQQAFVVPTDKAYCVYTHSHKGTVFYVGKGLLVRPFAPGRSRAWEAFVRQIGAYEVSIVLWTNDEAEALHEEQRLIRTLKPACNVHHTGQTKRERPRLVMLLPQETMDRLGAYRAARQAADPGAHLSLSAVVRDLMESALKTATDDIDAYIAHRQAAEPGAHLSRSDVVRELLDLALHTALPTPRRASKKGAHDAA